MNISQQNILKRWNLMSSKDLGTDINPIARDMADLAKKVLEENMTQISLKGYSQKFIRTLYGFCINYNAEFGDDENIGYEYVEVVTTLDLCHVNFSKHALEELDYSLMNDKCYDDQYLYALSI